MAAMQSAAKAAKALSAKKSECVQVVVRTRPLFGPEIKDGRQVTVTTDISLGQVHIKNPKAGPSDPPRTFTFDACYGADTKQKDMYDISASPIVDSVLAGYNGTIFAYGQTGAGKTHTMEGKNEPASERGIMPNAFKHIFDTINGNQDPTKQFLVRCSYIEIYNEDIHDLLSRDATAKKELKDSADRGVFVKDLQAVVVKSAMEMDAALQRGKKERHVGATLMNATSSRSHSIFTITVETSEVGADGQPHIRVGKLNLVDLAGSERQSKTGATGARLKEATKINLSLSALGNVIGALVDSRKKHIPYRDSKLTRLLQDSLGGNTKTMMVACVGPADYNYDESISTLRYADRAKQIKNKPKINEDPKDAMLREFQEEIERLKSMLEGRGPGGGTTTVMVDGQEITVPVGGGGGPTRVIEKIVGISEEEAASLRAQQAAAEAEAKSAAEARSKIAAEAAKTEEERQALAAKLEEAAAVAATEAAERRAAEKQLAKMQEKLLQGGKIMDKAAAQEAELRQAKLEIEERRKQEAAMATELAERELEMQEHYESVQSEIDDKTRKLRKAVTKYKEVKRELKDMASEFQAEKEDMLEVVREVEKDKNMYAALLKAFVPPAELQRLEAMAVWDDDTDTWHIPHLPLAGNRLRPRRPNVAGGDEPASHRPVTDYAKERATYDDNPRFLVENIVKFTLDPVDRTTEDYGGPDAHSRIPLMGEEEEDAALAAMAGTVATGAGGGRRGRGRPSSARRGGSRGGEDASFPVARGLRG